MATPYVLERMSSGARSDAAGKHFERAFTVVGKSEQWAWDKLYEQTGIRRGAQYTNINGDIIPFVVCKSMTATPMTPAPRNGYGLFDVTCQYGYPTTEYRRRSPGTNQIVYWVEYSFETIAVDTDWRGWPVCNAALESYDPPPTIEVPRFVLCMQWLQNFTGIEQATTAYLSYLGKINSYYFLGAAPGCFRCVQYLPEETNNPMAAGWTTSQYRVTMRFAFRPQKTFPNNQVAAGWDWWQIHRGNRLLKRVNNAWTTVPIKDPLDDTQFLHDQLLSADGQSILTPNQSNPLGLPAGVNWRIYQVYEQSDFNSILRNAGGYGGNGWG